MRFRITILLLTALGLLTSRMVACPHVHCQSSLSEQLVHNATPHVHLGRYGDCEAHRHATDREQPVGLGICGHSHGFDHDADAIYLPDTIGGGGAAFDGVKLSAPIWIGPSRVLSELCAVRSVIRCRHHVSLVALSARIVPAVLLI